MKKNKGLKKRNSSKSSQIRVNTIDEGEKLKKKSANKSVETSQEEVCDVCGHIGFINALMYCSACSLTAVHQYCLGIPPGSIDDKYYWLCDRCSLSVESQNQNSLFEESLSEHALALELETEQYKNTNILVEDELEPLCILPPLVHHGCLEHQCGTSEVIPNTSFTFVSHPLRSEEKYELASSVPRFKMYGGSYSQISEGISLNCSISSGLDDLFNDKEESEESVSSFMEFPKEITSGLVLLASPSGKIVIQKVMHFCSCLAPSIVNMASSCNEMNPEKQVNEPVDSCQQNTVCADGLQRKRKRTAARVKFDLIKPLGPECKRVRSKRRKISSSLDKEVYACNGADVPSMGKEDTHQETNILVNIDPSTRGGSQAAAIDKNCGLFSEKVDACGNIINERVQVQDGLCVQEININISDLGVEAQKLPFYNMRPNQDIPIASLASNKGISKSEALSSNSLVSSPRCVQFYQSPEVSMSTVPCAQYGVNLLKQNKNMDVEGDVLDKKVPWFKELGTRVLKSKLQRQPPLLCGDDLTSPMLEMGFATQIEDKHAIIESARDVIEEAFDNMMNLKESITYSNALKEYDLMFEKLKSELDKEKKRSTEAIKKNRRRMWKVVYELEITKKELQEKVVEHAKKIAEVEMAKDLALKQNEAYVQNQKEAYDLWLAGYSSALSVIYQFHPEFNWDVIKAVGNLMSLRCR